MNKFSCAIALVSCTAVFSCFGTETDNPVTSNPRGTDYTSPDAFGPQPSGGAPCVPPDPESVPYARGNYNGQALVTTSSGSALARADNRGLALVDVADPAAPRVLGRVNIPAVHDLLAGDAGVLWAIVSEPLNVVGPSVPSAAALELRLRLLQLDVSDPSKPSRVAQVDLDGEPWALGARDGALWVVTRRRTAEQRACDADRDTYGCATPAYEALVVRGFQPAGGALSPLSSAELPFEQRAWWGADAIVSALGTDLHVLTWQADGALAAPRTIGAASESELADARRTPLGPVDVVGAELRAVRASEGRVALDIYDLASGGPPRSFPLGELPEPPGGRSIFFRGHLWLQGGPDAGQAQLWDVSGAEPVRLSLPSPMSFVLPVERATRQNGAAGELLALGWDRASGDDAALLSIQGGSVSLIEIIDEPAWSPELGYGSLESAPSSLSGPGSFADHRLLQPGPGLPLVIEPSVVVPLGPEVRDSAAVISPDGAVVQATLQNAAQPELVFAGASTPFELSPGTSELLSTRTHVIALDTADLSRCQQTGADCSQHAPGARIFAVSGGPSLVGSLPLPELPLPSSTPTNQVSVSWEIYDDLTRSSAGALRLGDERLALVASVDLSCDTAERCDALGIEALPFGEANVVGGAIAPCPPPDIAPDCVPMTAAEPTVYGSSRRQYFYVLDLDAPGALAWQAWGESSLESSTARRDQGRSSRFAAPIASDGVLAATRLERESAAGELLPAGSSRFMLDRFALDAQGSPRALPPVNVPGYPIARLSSSDADERWLAVEAAPGESGHGRLLRLAIRDDAAHIESELRLDGGRFFGARSIRSEQAEIAVVLLAPDNACGTTQLGAVPVSAAGPGLSEGAAGALQLAASLELPADDWIFAASEGPLVLLRSFPAYVLVRVDPDASLTVVGSGTLPSVRGERLIGTTIYTADATAPQQLQLAP